MFRCVEEVGEESFLLYYEIEGFGKIGERHLKEAERIFETNVSSVDGQRLDPGAVDNLLRYYILLVEFVQDQVRIEPLRIMGQDRECGILS